MIFFRLGHKRSFVAIVVYSGKVWSVLPFKLTTAPVSNLNSIIWRSQTEAFAGKEPPSFLCFTGYLHGFNPSHPSLPFLRLFTRPSFSHCSICVSFLSLSLSLRFCLRITFVLQPSDRQQFSSLSKRNKTTKQSKKERKEKKEKKKNQHIKKRTPKKKWRHSNIF